MEIALSPSEYGSLLGPSKGVPRNKLRPRLTRLKKRTTAQRNLIKFCLPVAMFTKKLIPFAEIEQLEVTSLKN